MGWFQKVIYGVDLDAEQARQNELDRRLAEENKADLDNGTYTQDVFDQAEAQRQASYISDVSGQVGDAFQQGLSEGVDNIRNGVGSAVSFPFKLVPWQVWVIGLGVLLWYMGGWIWLRGVFNRK